MLFKSRALVRAAFYGGLLTIVAAGCDKKSSSDDGAAPAPELSVKAPEFVEGKAKITYQSPTADVRYECRVDVEDKAGEYEDCDPSGLEVKVRPGATYKVYVKAISKGGVESRAVVRSFVAPGAAAQQAPSPEQQQQQQAIDIAQLHTLIQNRDQLGQYDSLSGEVRVAATKVVFQFGIEGNAIAPAELRYECRVGKEPKFQDCNGSSYTLDGLEDGGSYSIAVRAVSRTSGRMAQEDALAIRVAMPGISITNQSQLENSMTGQVRLSLQGSCQSYRYTIDGGVGAQPTCQSGIITVDLDSQYLKPGSHKLVIEAASSQSGSQTSVSTSISFCARTCSGSTDAADQTAPAPGRMWPYQMALGSGFAWNLDQETHVTEYSTTKTTGVLNFFRIAQGDGPQMDPYYLGIEHCGGPWDLPVSRSNRFTNSPTYRYCQSTMPREVYKAENEFRLALNHIEVASNPHPNAGWNTDSTPPGYERISISVFDADYEYMNSRSRFWNLCQNSWQKNVYNIPMLNNFFRWDIPADVDFFTCEAILPNPISGEPEEWRVGAFFALRGGRHMDFGCGCSYPEAVEMVYMTRPTAGTMFDFQFAQVAQSRILDGLIRTQPN